jgi:hypothetical protein
MVDTPLTHRQILDLWRDFAPGRSQRFFALLGSDLGVHRKVVRQWYLRERIPRWHWPALIEAVERRFGRVLTENDLEAGFERNDKTRSEAA